MSRDFDWIDNLSEEGRSMIQITLEDFLVTCEDYVPIELYDDDTLSKLLELQDVLKQAED